MIPFIRLESQTYWLHKRSYFVSCGLPVTQKVSNQKAKSNNLRAAEGANHLFLLSFTYVVPLDHAFVFILLQHVAYEYNSFVHLFIYL